MLRLCLIGAGNIDFHYFDLLKIDKKKFYEHIDKIAKVLAESNLEISLLPERGICFEIAKKYKEFDGKSVCGVLPISDKVFGVKHLQQQMEAEVNGKKIFDKFIDTINWEKQHFAFCLFSDIVLMLGVSLGTLYEIGSAYYVYKIFAGDKKGVSVDKKKIHPEIRAGNQVSFSTIVYTPLIKGGKLPLELEVYIKRYGNLYYAKDSEEIKSILNLISR